MKEVLFVGWVNKGKTPVDGETTKNQYIIEELQKYCKIRVLDFYNKKAHPWIFLQALWAFISKPKATIILSTSAKNVYSILVLLKKLHIKREIIHWVVGGAFGNLVQDGTFKAEIFNFIKLNLVQCHKMITQLESAGVQNAKFISNFKEISYYPPLEKCLEKREQSNKIKFVFLSRIRESKGCRYILEAVNKLNQKGYSQLFLVDFYGKVDASYKEEFFDTIQRYENVSYKGILNLRENNGYDQLATYNAMLFPTFHPSEGVAGVFIDAFIAGLPVIASDWAYNPECIEHGKQGLLFPTHNIDALAHAMESCIIGKIDLKSMAKNARAEASKYETKNVINKESLEELDLITK